jgi:inner membrane protein
MLVTPSAFNTVLWRVLVITPQGYAEGYYSLLDERREVTFDHFDRGEVLFAAARGNSGVERIAAFSHGFFKMSVADGQLRITDLRMGMEPNYTFSFVVADSLTPQVAVPSVRVPGQRNLQRALPWLGRRILGEAVAPPR